MAAELLNRFSLLRDAPGLLCWGQAKKVEATPERAQAGLDLCVLRVKDHLMQYHFTRVPSKSVISFFGRFVR